MITGFLFRALDRKAIWVSLALLAFLVWGLVVMQWERLTPFYAAALLLAITFLKKDLRLDPRRVRLEVTDGAAKVRDVFAAYSDRVGSVTLGRPSLEDVFIRFMAESKDNRFPLLSGSRIVASSGVSWISGPSVPSEPTSVVVWASVSIR